MSANGSAPKSMDVPPARRVQGMCTRSFNKTGFDWLIDWFCICQIHIYVFVIVYVEKWNIL